MGKNAALKKGIARICVFCGSSDGSRPAYRACAHSLGRLLAERRIELIYGGSNVGLMKALADAALDGGGQVTGVIPEALAARGLAHPGLTRLHTVESMHQRKALMAELSDAFIALPGGYGTLEELSEALSWAQLGLHGKPCGVLNVEGYYDFLIGLLDHWAREGFLPARGRALRSGRGVADHQ